MYVTLYFVLLHSTATYAGRTFRRMLQSVMLYCVVYLGV